MRRAAKVDESRLGQLCRKGHEYGGTGYSLRHKSGHCAECVKEARATRMKDPAKAAREMECRRIRSSRRRKGDSRQPMTPERRREIARASKAKGRALEPLVVQAKARTYYAKNSVKISLRNRVYRALKRQGIQKVRGPRGFRVRLAEIAAHLGPCPGERGEWHIDHIRPLASFDLSDDAQLQQAFAPENHQWLPARENIIKGARYE